MVPPRRIATLLFFSGLCALIYQIAWLRELRLVFGASTWASAAVLAVFMGGLGLGSWTLGGRVDRSPAPLRLYAKLEAGIALTAACTPLLLLGVRRGYIALGGSEALGLLGGTVVRLLLTALVLLLPTWLMGGTLPAAARAVTRANDKARRATGLLYGVNTLGAVCGALLATFVLLEWLGSRATLWLGCSVNGLVAAAAWWLSRGRKAMPSVAGAAQPTAPAGASTAAAAVEPRFLLLAAAAVGFVFLLMELIWYRVLGPLLGGSSYTFGLILALALLGIGIGGVLYARRPLELRASPHAFAVSCLLEAVCIAIPFALGDRLALLAVMLRSLSAGGFVGLVFGWACVAAVVVVPAAVVAGYQFPLLIGLLGRGDDGVGKHVGLAYAANTVGAIAGSLAGGFVVLPQLSALGGWKLAVWILVVLALATLWVGRQAFVAELARARRQLSAALGALRVPGLALLAVTLMHASLGPTAVWRHSPIGAGRAGGLLLDTSHNGMRQALRERRRAITWEVDGRESSIGLYTLNDTAFLVNGKSDGGAVVDGGTQVMGGLLGTLVKKGRVRRALVIGLGTGSTAGWLAAHPDIERVDVVELEPQMRHVAEVCTSVNHGVLQNPKVRLIIADARELLLTSDQRYDLIFSEPSNPYRAGVASLFTQEFYQAVQQRLQPDGMFVQWVQAYEIDSLSLRSVYATLVSVFPSVESWRTKADDLVLINRQQDAVLDVAQLRQRIAQEPYRSALMNVWRTASVEGIVARFVAQPAMATELASASPQHINRDDRNTLEFALPRAMLGRDARLMDQLLEFAQQQGVHRPRFAGGSPNAVNWLDVVEEQLMMAFAEGHLAWSSSITPSQAQARRFAALAAWHHEKPAATVIEMWSGQKDAARHPIAQLVLAEAYAQLGDERAEPLLANLRSALPLEADAIAARLAWTRGKPKVAWAALDRALTAFRADPWADSRLMIRTAPLALEIAKQVPELSAEVAKSLSHPWGVNMLHYLRVDLRLSLALLRKDKQECLGVAAEYGALPPWDESTISRLEQCMRLAGDARSSTLAADLAELRAHNPQPLAP